MSITLSSAIDTVKVFAAIDLRFLVIQQLGERMEQTSSTSVLFPDPETPVTQVNSPSGIFAVMFLRLCFLRRPLMENSPLALRFAARHRRPSACRGRYWPVSESGSPMTSFGVPCAMTCPPCVPGARPHVEQWSAAIMVSASCSTTTTVLPRSRRRKQGLQQAPIVPLMEPDRRLIENVEDADEAGTDLRRQPDALALTAGQCGRRPIQRQIIQTDVDEKPEPLANLFQDAMGNHQFALGEFQRTEELGSRPDR